MQNKLLFSFCLSLGFYFNLATLEEFSGIVFDTQARDSVCCAPMFKLASQHGLKLEYVGIDKILDSRIEHFLERQDRLAFFVIDVPFLRSWTSNKGNLGINYFLKLLNLLSQKPNLTVVLMLPPLGKTTAQQTVILKSLLQTANFDLTTVSEELQQAAKDFVADPLEARKMPFHTALNLPMASSLASINSVAVGQNTMLPKLPSKISHLLQNFLPLSLSLTSNERRIILTSAQLFFLLGPCQNFQILPLERYLQDELIKLFASFFADLSNSLRTPSELKVRRKPVPVPSVMKLFESLEFATTTKVLDSAKHQFNKVSWMELDVPLPEAQLPAAELAIKQQDLTKLVDQTLTSGIDWVWINLSPNTFVSDGSIYRDRKDLILQKLDEFGSLLGQKALQQKKPMPRFLLGFELGNNIVEKNKPKAFACDIFGNGYDDIPSPLSFDFWQDEFLKPLASFLSSWQAYPAAKLMPVEGIVLDIEFYNRKWTSSFLSTMGFEDTSKNLFCINRNEKHTPKTTDELISKLATEKRYQEYFKTLEQLAKSMGNKLRQQANLILPNKPFGVYLPNLTFDWFSNGFFSGLSSKEPIHLFSFNTATDLVGNLLAQKKINASHSAAFMLSKIKDYEDFGHAKELFEQNRSAGTNLQSGGIWLNRFSRLAQKYQPGQWFFLEQTAAPESQKQRFCNFLSTLK